MIFGAARIAMWFVKWLPSFFANFLGEIVGVLGFHLARSEQKKTLEGLRVAFPDLSEKERRKIGLRCFATLGRRAAEICRMDRLDLSKHVEIDGESEVLINEALAQNRGLIWVTAHFGNWEFLAAGLTAHGYDVRPIAKQSYDPRFTETIDRWRLRHRVRTIWRGKDQIPEQVSKALSEGAIVGLLIDQDTKIPGVFVPFFGKLAWTPRGASEIARGTGSPVLAGFIFPKEGGGHIIYASKVALRTDGDPEDVDASNTALFTQHIENAIKKQPEQWVWMHQRWKTRPEDVKKGSSRS